MPQLGEPPTLSGTTMQELGVRWQRLGTTMGGLGGESIAESYADQRLTALVQGLLTLNRTQAMPMTLTIPPTD